MSAGRVPVPLVVGRRMERAWHRSYDPRVPHTLEYPLECLPRIVEKTAAAFPRNTALEFLGKIIDYKTFQNQVERFAAALHLLGVEPGMRVAVMLPNCPQTVIAYHAVLRLGGVAVMTNPMYVERELEHQWGDSDAEVLVVLDHLYPKVEKVLPQTRIRKVIVTGIREYLPFLLKWLYPLKARRQKLFTDVPYDGDSVLNFSDLVKNTGTPPPPCLVQLDDLAQIQYTGGTTGSPKGVMLTHRNILANLRDIGNPVPVLTRALFPALFPAACNAGSYSAGQASFCSGCPTSSTSSNGASTCTCNAGFSTIGSGVSLSCTGASESAVEPRPARVSELTMGVRGRS